MPTSKGATFRVTVAGGRLVKQAGIVDCAATIRNLLLQNPAWRPHIRPKTDVGVTCRVRLDDGEYSIDAFKTAHWNKPADRRPEWADQLDHILNTHA